MIEYYIGNLWDIARLCDFVGIGLKHNGLSTIWRKKYEKTVFVKRENSPRSNFTIWIKFCGNGVYFSAFYGGIDCGKYGGAVCKRRYPAGKTGGHFAGKRGRYPGTSVICGGMCPAEQPFCLCGGH